MSVLCLAIFVSAELCEVAVTSPYEAVKASQSISNPDSLTPKPSNSQQLLSEESVQLSVRSDSK